MAVRSTSTYLCLLSSFALAGCGANSRFEDELASDLEKESDASASAPDGGSPSDDPDDREANGSGRADDDAEDDDSSPAARGDDTDGDDREDDDDDSPGSDDSASGEPDPDSELDGGTPGCSTVPPARPTILSPENNARDLPRAGLVVRASAFEDVDGHELAAAEFEIRAYTGTDDAPLVWSGKSESGEIRLADGTFADPSVDALEFERNYTLSVRFEDTGDCNNLSEWSPAVLFRTGDGSEELFDPEIVRTIELTIPTDNGPPSSWDSIEAEARTESCTPTQRNYYTGSVAFEGVVYEDVGIHIKGGCGSWRSLDDKPGFKLKFDWDENPDDDVCPEERKVFGRGTFTLNNGVQDRSAMREHLTYRYFREAGVPAPRTAAIQVYVNGVYYGVYQNIETIDRRFLRRFFDESDGKGMMYEGAYWCDFFTGNDSDYEDGHCWDREFNLDACDGSPDALDDLQFYESDGTTPQDPWQFLAGLHSKLETIADSELYYPEVANVVDWDAFLTYWATGAVVVDWDNYVYNQNNFRVYHHPATDLWHFIPWGVDQTWGEGFRGRFAALDVNGDVARLCLDAAGDVDGKSCTDAAVERLHDAVNQFDDTDWLTAIDEWQERLDPLMQLDDPRRSYDYEAWIEAVDELRTFAAERRSRLADELAESGYTLPE